MRSSILSVEMGSSAEAGSSSNNTSGSMAMVALVSTPWPSGALASKLSKHALRQIGRGVHGLQGRFFFNVPVEGSHLVRPVHAHDLVERGGEVLAPGEPELQRVAFDLVTERASSAPIMGPSYLACSSQSGILDSPKPLRE